MSEALADIYKEKLLEPNVDQSQVLLTFFNVLFSTSHNGKILAQFRKLVKLYGVTRVYNAILSAHDIENFRSENPYGILAYFCKQSLSGVKVESSYIDIEKIKGKKRVKVKIIGDPFDGS